MQKNEELKNVVESSESNVIEENTDNETSSKKAEVTNDISSKEKTNVNKKEKEKVVDEETVIEKIKNFIAKIVAMQEEARKEKIEEDKDEEENLKEQVSKTETTAKTSKKTTDYMLEYYDLPYRYNETVVKVLAQTPKKLFVYWDISDNDKQKYIDTFGEDFFYKTYPVLLLYNEDKQYVKEIPINDFANSWYIDIQDPKTKYIIQLGRKFKEEPKIVNMARMQEENIILRTDYLPFADSNIMEAPNDHILFETLPRFLTFRNVKTNEEYTKDLKSLKDIFGNNYDVEEFYKKYYEEEVTDGVFDMSNPSSKLTSSTFK